MWKSPFIFRAIHEAIVAAQDSSMESLQRENQRLTEMLNEERGRTEKFANQLIDLARPSSPAPTDRKQRTVGGDEPRPMTSSIDLAMVDPEDNEAVMMILRNEMPGGAIKVNGSQLQRSIENLRERIRDAKRARNSPGVPPGPPPDLLSRIDDAVAAGRQDARGIQ